ncbi:hypothetical protein BGZ70_004291, partial [Mortierella alpina]
MAMNEGGIITTDTCDGTRDDQRTGASGHLGLGLNSGAVDASASSEGQQPLSVPPTPPSPNPNRNPMPTFQNRRRSSINPADIEAVVREMEANAQSASSFGNRPVSRSRFAAPALTTIAAMDEPMDGMTAESPAEEEEEEEEEVVPVSVGLGSQGEGLPVQLHSQPLPSPPPTESPPLTESEPDLVFRGTQPQLGSPPVQKKDFVLNEKVDDFVQSRSSSVQHRRFTDADEGSRTLKAKYSRSQDHDDPIDGRRRREERDRKAERKKAEGQEDLDDDFESHSYPRYNSPTVSPQLQRRKQQQQRPQDQQHKSYRAINEQRQPQGQFSPTSTGRKSMQSPTFSTPPRPSSQTPKKKGTPIAIPSLPMTEYDRPRPRKPFTPPTYTPSHIPRTTILSPSPTPRSSVLKKGRSTDLTLKRHSPLLDSDSDLEEDIFSGTPQGIRKKPQDTAVTGSTRSSSISSSSSKDFEDTAHSRPQSKKSQPHGRSHDTKTTKARGSRKEHVSASNGMEGDEDDDDRRDATAAVADVDDDEDDEKDSRPDSWKVNEENKERFRNFFSAQSLLPAGAPRMSTQKSVVGKKSRDTETLNNKDKDSLKRDDRSVRLFDKSRQGASPSERSTTKKSQPEKTLVKSTPDHYQRKELWGSTTPSTPSAMRSQDRVSPSTPQGQQKKMADRNNSMPSPADHAALDLFVLDHGNDNDDDGDEDEDEDDKPRRKRRHRPSHESATSSSDSDHPARPSSEGPRTPKKRDRGSNIAASSPS